MTHLLHRRFRDRPSHTRQHTVRCLFMEEYFFKRHHHSDQGVHYASQPYVTRLETAGCQLSMAAVGNPYENARAESFFKTLKREEVYLNDDQSFAEAEAHLDHFIAAVYNQKRLHSSLGSLPPVEFEAACGVLETEPPSLERVR